MKFLLLFVTLFVSCFSFSQNEINLSQKELITDVQYSITRRSKKIRKSTLFVKGDSVNVFGKYDSWHYKVDSVIVNTKEEFEGIVLGGHYLSESPSKTHIKITKDFYYINRVGFLNTRSWCITYDFVNEFESNLLKSGVSF